MRKLLLSTLILSSLISLTACVTLSPDTQLMSDAEVRTCASEEKKANTKNNCQKALHDRMQLTSVTANPKSPPDGQLGFVKPVEEEWIIVSPLIKTMIYSSDHNIVHGWLRGIQAGNTIMSRYELSCRSKTLREYQELTYNSDGKLIRNRENHNTQFNIIVPKSIGADLYFKVCHQQ
ncbi:hypothetical protein [Lelliottia sp. WAP21]|uniref:hypothetical protein n=1 Tax=Lelliottia sp. WAP21 TaxID=2877426 RepID=UPI001E43602D|nr:hypothetical protein [Lelliottia sp. WAP21]